MIVSQLKRDKLNDPIIIIGFSIRPNQTIIKGFFVLSIRIEQISEPLEFYLIKSILIDTFFV